MDRSVQEDWKRRFHGKTIIEAKYIPKFPSSSEREYLRLSSAFMRTILSECLKKHLPEIKAVMIEVDSKQRFDSSKKQENQKQRTKGRIEELDTVIVRFKTIFKDMEKYIISSMGVFNLVQKLTRIGESTERFSKKEWGKAINKTLGVSILDDYYQGEFYRTALKEWIQTNVELIESIPKNFLDEFADVVYQNYISGRTMSDLAAQIQKDYGTYTKHAKLISRDQIGKLNAQITKYQQKNAGCNKYKWRSVGDERVRDRHRELDKQIFSWDDPPVVDKRIGRRCHPGEDYQCRCIARPIFNRNTTSLPIADDVKVSISKGKY